MRRKPTEEKNSLYSIKSLKLWFKWKQCYKCGEEVRREIIYEINIYYNEKIENNVKFSTWGREIGHDQIIFCSKCCLNLENAQELFKKDLLPNYKKIVPQDV